MSESDKLILPKAWWDYVLEALEPTITPALKKIEQDLSNQNLPVHSAAVTVARTLLTNTDARQKAVKTAKEFLEDDDDEEEED